MITLIQSIIDLAKSLIGLIKPAAVAPDPITPGVIKDTEKLTEELEK